MTDPTPAPLPSRRFNEKEVAHIIKRASELQQDEAPTESNSGMSLAELEQVARETGLDPALVRRAATDLDTRVSDQRPSGFIGAPTSLRLERTIDGEVSPEEYESIVLEIQRELGGVGAASTFGRSQQWTMSGVPPARNQGVRVAGSASSSALGSVAGARASDAARAAASRSACSAANFSLSRSSNPDFSRCMSLSAPPDSGRLLWKLLLALPPMACSSDEGGRYGVRKRAVRIRDRLAAPRLRGSSRAPRTDRSRASRSAA